MDSMKFKKALLGVGMFAFVESASAAFVCSGEVEAIGIDPPSGMLSVNTGHGMHFLCNLNQEANGVSANVCQAWYSMFLSAQASGRPVIQSYQDAAGKNCGNLGSWVVPDPFPYHVELHK